MDNMDSSNTSVKIMSNIKLREQFVEDLNGTSMGEVMMFSIQTPLLIFIVLSLEFCILSKFNINLYKTSQFSVLGSTVSYVLEAFTVVLPVLFMFTVLSDFLNIVFLSIVLVITIIITLSVSSPNDSVLYWKLPYFKRAYSSEITLKGKQPFITYFRSLVLLVTAISILGVDFHIYPRRFAKTETYGVSLMDLGVGLFVFSNALVIKRCPGFHKTLVESTVLLILGILRYLLIQRFDYQKHITEYGLHWNFFITLATVKLLSYMFLKVSRGYNFICGLALMLLHQYCLSYSLEAKVLNNKDRSDWFNANLEGVTSLCGYLSIYIFGVGVASIVNPVDKALTLRKKVKIILLFSAASASLYLILYYCNNINFKVSRRLANLPFILWITTMSLTLISVSLTVELFSICFLPIQPRFKNDIYLMLTPTILESINYNGLLFFLVSNLLTGFINVYIDVFNSNTLNSMFVLLIYTFVNCTIVFILYVLSIQVKVW